MRASFCLKNVLMYGCMYVITGTRPGPRKFAAPRHASRRGRKWPRSVAQDQGAALMSAGNPVHLAERYMSNPTRMFSMNMPVDVHRALKREAFERETTMGEIVLDALKQWGIAQQINEEGAGREDDRNRE